ncbi:hypothetical protein [Pseudomonas sp. BW16M2]|nr:hypothetical protein [Pseudomonas sp. BW16M2]
MPLARSCEQLALGQNCRLFCGAYQLDHAANALIEDNRSSPW